MRSPTGVPGPFSPNTSDKEGLTTAVLSLECGGQVGLSGGSVVSSLYLGFERGERRGEIFPRSHDNKSGPPDEQEFF